MEHNPQAAQMSDESMVRNLAAQAEAIWPQEAPLFDRYGTPARVVDLACGTGEISSRLLTRFPDAELVGLDLDADHLARARARCGERGRFAVADAFATGQPDGSFDLGVCRHLLQAVPEPHRVVAELARMVRPGGWVHLLAEDYAMIHFPSTTRDMDRFWQEGPITFGRQTGTDLRSGRETYRMCRRLGLEEVRVDYVTVDTVRVSRETFAAIWTAWRDGFTEVLAEKTRYSVAEVRAHWDDMIATLREPDSYAVWQIPIVSGRRPR